MGKYITDEIIDEICRKMTSPADRQWFRERYPELRDHFIDFYLNQVEHGKMTREQSLKACKRAIIDAVDMEISLRR